MTSRVVLVQVYKSHQKSLCDLFSPATSQSKHHCNETTGSPASLRGAALLSRVRRSVSDGAGWRETKRAGETERERLATCGG